MKAPSKQTMIISSSILLLLIVFLAVNYFIWQNSYRGRFYPGTSIGNLILSGKTRGEAKKELEARFQSINKAGLSFQYNKQAEKLDLDVISFDSDLSRPTLIFNSEGTLNTSFNQSDSDSFFHFLRSFFFSKAHKTFIPFYSLDEDSIKSFLNDNFGNLISRRLMLIFP